MIDSPARLLFTFGRATVEIADQGLCIFILDWDFLSTEVIHGKIWLGWSSEVFNAGNFVHVQPLTFQTKEFGHRLTPSCLQLRSCHFLRLGFRRLGGFFATFTWKAPDNASSSESGQKDNGAFLSFGLFFIGFPSAAPSSLHSCLD